MSRHAADSAASGTPRLHSLVPGRDDLTDAGFVLALGLIALAGFRTTFDGVGYLIAGGCGLLLGILLAHLATALRQPLILLAAVTVVVFFLLGGAIALRSEAIAGFLPGGKVLKGLAEQSIHGWKDLLTTLPPVPGNGPLLVLPYLIGLVGGALGHYLARRIRFAAAALPVPVAVLVLVLLLGDLTPSAKYLHGVGVGVLALAWVAVRNQRLRPVVHSGSGRTARAGTAVVLLGAAGVAAAFLGPHLPGAGERVVLRKKVDPPVNIDQYPSPLTLFRKFKTTDKDRVLFRVDGLPDGTPVRIATLDSYDGYVWSASNPDTSQDGVLNSFRRIGARVDVPRGGTKVSYTVSVPDGGYNDVWLPDAGELTSVTFHGAAAGEHQDDLRYNLATGTGLVPDGLRPGDSYTVKAVLPDTSLPKDADPGSTTSGVDASFVSQKATQLAGEASAPLDRLQNVISSFQSGYYTDGVGADQQTYLPGHSKFRIASFFVETQLVGDDEQYAAALALVANSDPIGVPARVVYGATPRNGVVTGADIHAWVEVQLLDGSWRTIPSSAFVPPTDRVLHQQPKPQDQKQNGQQILPPAVTHPKTSQADGDAVGGTVTQKPKAKPKPKPKQGLAAVGAWVWTAVKWGGPPIGGIVLIALAIVGAKLLRRWRRRSTGPPTQRLTRGWRDVVDFARDLGGSVPAGRTRREQAVLLGHPELGALAHAADAHVFGADAPAEQDATAYWQQLDATRRSLARQHGRWRRLRAAVSLASFRRLKTAAS